MDAEAITAEIKRRIKAGEGTGAGFARLLGIHPTAFSKLLTGKRQLKAAEADRLRQYLGLRDEGKTPSPRQLPIVGLISAGTWQEGFERVIGHMPSPDPTLSRDAFVVIVEGDSMDLVAEPGEAVIVDPRDRNLIDGKLYIVRNAEGESTFKRYRENPARLEPCSSDARHATIYPGQDGFEVVGRARKKVVDL